jgi:TadE-like protein
MKLPMRRPLPARQSTHPRGQALVEMAIMLPVLILMLLLAVDFGRVFFGWVALNNATRIGANEAAKNPSPWSLGDIDDLYYSRMTADLSALNCAIPDYDGDGRTNETDGSAELIQDLKAAPSPDVQPQFVDNADTADPYEAGDLVTVNLDCDFSFITPIVGLIVGDPMPIRATATFTVFGGEINGIPVPPDPIPAGCIGTDKEVPNLVSYTVAEARSIWSNAGFTGAFSPATGSDDNIVTTQSTSPSASVGDCLLYTASVSVSHKVPDTCDVTESTVPNLVGMTVSAARSAWTGAGFSGGFIPLSGSDTDIVSAQTTAPSSSPGDCLPLTAQVNVSHAPPPPPAGQCTMPQLLGLQAEPDAHDLFNAAGFSGTFNMSPNKPLWKVKNQNLVGGQNYACTSSVTVQVENK